VSGLVGLNVLVFVLAGDSLHHSRLHYERRAESLTQSIAGAVDQSVSGSIARIDLALRTVADELERQLAGKGIDEKSMNAFLARQEQRLPEVEAFRVANADGLVIMGKGLNKQAKTTWADRDYFIYHRDHTDRTLQISKPRVGRVAQKYIIGFAQRYNYPDGRFAGVVSAPIALDHFSNILAQFDLGPKGTLNLRDADLGLITRVPALPDKPAGQIGNNVVSRELRQLFDSGQQTMTYYTAASADGFERISTFRRLATAPMMVLVGVAKEDYLSGWAEETYRTLAMATGFMALSALLGSFLLRLLGQAEKDGLRLRQFKAIVDSTDDAVIGKTLNGIITSWNSGAEKIFGYTAEEAIGNPMGMLIPPERANEEPDILARIARCERVTHFETLRRRKDGRLINISATISPIVDDGGNVIGASKIARDITGDKQIEAELAQYRNHLENMVEERTAALSIAKEAAEAANRAKTVFLANMSHELRTPMNGIMGMTSLALRSATDPKQVNQLTKVAQSAEKLLTIIDDILNYSKMESERLTLESTDFRLDTVLEALVALKGQEARDKGLQLITNNTPGLMELRLRGDAQRIGQILAHLTSNAIKFTTEGSVTVRALMVEDNPDDVLIRFEIVDTGMGISADDQKRLFSAFEQADGSMTRKHGGIGLGLALSKRLVQAMGGRIGVVSTAGGGSTFWFTARLVKVAE
jgi:PAS domain S-box-containing protein